jgi:hypothetical protein
LHETNDNIEQNDGSYYTTFNPRLNSKTDGHSSNQNLGKVRKARLLLVRDTYQCHSVCDLSEEDLARRDTSIFTQVIVSMFFKSRLRLRSRESIIGITLGFLDNLVEGQGVGGLR